VGEVACEEGWGGDGVLPVPVLVDGVGEVRKDWSAPRPTMLLDCSRKDWVGLESRKDWPRSKLLVESGRKEWWSGEWAPVGDSELGMSTSLSSGICHSVLAGSIHILLLNIRM